MAGWRSTRNVSKDEQKMWGFIILFAIIFIFFSTVGNGFFITLIVSLVMFLFVIMIIMKLIKWAEKENRKT
ncbi:hypothetical protein D0S48_04370 [Psychrobacillus sp. AK 1817]|nr:hypothetical protein D0S48_04370 [Psychrobacillus sp. AK 1817]